MGMKKQPKDLFARCEGMNFVRLDYSGISFLIACIDGLSTYHFEDSKYSYVKVDDVIAWHEKELDISNGRSGSKKVIEHLKNLKQKWAEEDLKAQEATND